MSPIPNFWYLLIQHVLLRKLLAPEAVGFCAAGILVCSYCFEHVLLRKLLALEAVGFCIAGILVCRDTALHLVPEQNMHLLINQLNCFQTNFTTI